jgi:TonB family protein
MWQGVIVAFGLKILLLTIPHSRPQLRYTLATFAMLANLALLLITFSLVYEPQYTVFASQLTAYETLQNGLLPSRNIAFTSYQQAIGIFPFISITWLLAVGLLAAKLCIELRNVNRLSTAQTRLPNRALAERFATLVNQVQLTKPPQLLISLKTDVPMAIGWLKPVVLIPVTMLTGLTPAQLDMLILHELAHIRRHDYLVNFFQTLIETLLFFHPAVTWISKQIRNEREFCTDDIAVKISGNPVAYAYALADTASVSQTKRNRAIPTMAMASSGGDLKQRIVRLVNHHQHCSHNDDSGKWLASAVIIVSVFLVAIKPYISFPIMDLTSGHISLLHKSSVHNKTQPVIEPIRSATTLAQQILTQAPSNDENFGENKKVPTLVNQAVLAKNNRDQSTYSDSLATNTTIKNKLISSNLPTDTLNRNNNSALISAENNSFNEQNTVTTDKLYSDVIVSDNKTLTVQSPSISEQAFLQTDSKKPGSAMANPYLEQVMDLANEPNYPTQYHQLDNAKLPRTKDVLTAKITGQTKPALADRQQLEKSPKRIDAKIISSVGPRYPSMAKRKGLELDVVVNFTIDKQGRVTNIGFNKGSKVNYFKNAVRNAMEKWRFLPAQLNGQPVESKMSKIFSFSLLK